MFSFRGSDGTPDPNISYAAILMQAALGGNHRALADQVAAYLGGTVVAFEVDKATVPNDYCVVTFPDGAWVSLYGTTNRDQVWFYGTGGVFADRQRPPHSGDGSRFRVNGGFQNALDIIEPNILALLNSTQKTKMRISGHSYGGGVGQVWVKRLYNQSGTYPNIEFLGFGTPKSFAGGSPGMAINYWARIEAQDPTDDPYYLRFISSNVDPITLLPPNGSLLTHYSIVFAVVAALFQDKWQHYGEVFAVDAAGTWVEPVAKNIPLLLGKLEIAYISSQITGSLALHYVASSYLPRLRQHWATAPSRDPALSQFDAWASIISGTPIPPLDRLGPTITPTNLNESYTGNSVGPVNGSNIQEFSIVSPNVYFSSFNPIQGSSTMSQFKGTLLFNSADGPFSESVYSTVTTETQATMIAKMKALSTFRMPLSCGPDLATCQNPIIPYGIRVEDELVLRDGQIVLAVQQGSPAQGEFYNPGASWQGSLPSGSIVSSRQNLSLDLCTRVKVASGQPQQVAYIALHGIPFSAVASANAAGQIDINAAFTRVANFNGVYQQVLYNYLAAMGSMGLGFRSIAGAWNTAQNTPGGYSNPDIWAYDSANQQVQLWWLATTRASVPAPLNTNAWPAGRTDAPPNWPNPNALCRLQVRKWKSFPVLQGRWAARVLAPATVNSVAYAWGLQILRQCRQPTISATNVPQVSPIAWNAWTPGNVPVTNPMTGSNPTFNGSALPVQAIRDTCSIRYVEEKKVGKVPYGAEPGRSPNRPT